MDSRSVRQFGTADSETGYLGSVRFYFKPQNRFGNQCGDPDPCHHTPHFCLNTYIRISDMHVDDTEKKKQRIENSSQDIVPGNLVIMGFLCCFFV